MIQTLSRRRLRLWPLITSTIVIALVMAVVLFMQSANAAVTSVTIGTSTKSLDGTNTGRDVNQLILYTYSTSQTKTPTNQYGIEVAVNASNVITAVNNRLQTGSTTGTTIPSGGYVLSGHGWGTSTSGYTWLVNNAQIGKTVVLNGSAPSDTTAPTTSLSAPADNSTATVGSTVNVAATATDNVGVSKVDFLVNGAVVSTDTTSPYEYAWNTTGLNAGNYTITAKAYDAAGNVGTSSARTVALAAAPTGGFNADGVNLGVPAVTVNGNNVSYNWTVQTNKSVTFRYLQVAVRPSNDTGFNNNITINGTRTFTSSHTLANGTYTAFVAYYIESKGVWVNGPTVEYTVGTTTPADTTNPSVSVSAPATATVGDTVPVTATASDNVGVTKVEFLVNGVVVSTDTTSPYEYSWNTTGLSAGNYTLSTKAYDAANNVGSSTATTVSLANPSDTTAPTTTITSPSNNANVTVGDTVNVAANASDNVGVSKVEFLLNGNVVATDTTAPYTYAWDTTGLSTGNYTLTTKAYDAADNTGTSSAVVVTVNAPQPTISATATVNAANSTATLQWTTSGSDPSEWTVGRDGTDSSGYGAWSGTIPGDRRSHVFNYLRPGATYNLTVSASDGRTATATVTMPSAEPTDTTAPATSITAPTANSSFTVGSTVTIAANASDNVGVTKVEFLVNGSVIGTTTSSPYSFAWNTTGRSAGSYSLTTKAYDAANNVGTSSTVQVTLTSTPPATGDWLSGVATVENGNGADPAKYFSDWRGTPVEIGQTWPHTPDVWGINPSVANSWSGFQGPMSLSYTPGPDWQGLQGWRSWSAMANGNMDAWWRAAAKQTKEFRQGKGTTYVSPFYEYNGDWMDWSVPRTTQGMADFRAAWERVAAIWRQEFPGVHLVLPAACSRDVPAAMMPNPNSYDHVGCTIYNAWPWEGNGAINVQRMEVGRQRALANGKSFVITEWANSGNPNEQGGGGDAPGFIQAFHSYFAEHAGTGPGQLEFETFFNIDGYALDHILVRRNGTGVTVNSTQPQTAAKYQQLF